MLGDDYVEWLRRTYGVGIKDYCVYWFRKAHDELLPGQRAGLVGTNSVSQNRARSASLAYIVENGGLISSAVSSQDWPGEASVDVSIVNWVKNPNTPPEHPRLDGKELDEAISASLRPLSLAVDTAVPLERNEGFAFYGPIPGGRGFILDPQEAEELLGAHGPEWRDVIRPYLTGNDILSRPDHGPSRFIIDFGFRALEEASRFREAVEIVRQRVKPQRDTVRRQGYRENWWRFSEPIREMRTALEGLERYIAAPAQGKRIPFVWVDAWTCPSNLTTVFALDDDYSIGVLSSSVHGDWALAQASTLEDRTRYTTSSTFNTFPWPQPSPTSRDEIAQVARELVDRRSLLCQEHGVGLTRLYNLLEDGAYRGLRELHQELDQAVAAAYGWPVAVAENADERNALLLALNKEIAEGRCDYLGPQGR